MSPHPPKQSIKHASRHDFPNAMSWTWLCLNDWHLKGIFIKVIPQNYTTVVSSGIVPNTSLFCFFPLIHAQILPILCESNYSHPASIIFPSITLLCACIRVCVCVCVSSKISFVGLLMMVEQWGHSWVIQIRVQTSQSTQNTQMNVYLWRMLVFTVIDIYV